MMSRSPEDRCWFLDREGHKAHFCTSKARPVKWSLPVGHWEVEAPRSLMSPTVNGYEVMENEEEITHHRGPPVSRGVLCAFIPLMTGFVVWSVVAVFIPVF